MNLIGVFLIVVAYLVSTAAVVLRDHDKATGSSLNGDTRVVQIMHWQLEPGYREALQSIIDRYNALPKVKQAGVRVEQLPVTERVYAQLLNVHAISGTAPDLCEMGMSVLVGGSGIAQFFEALGPHVNQPNPYNSADRLPEGLSGTVAQRAKTRPWRETLIDGMEGGWNPVLQDFYAVPTSFYGSIKIYYNQSLIDEARQKLREAVSGDARPTWFTRRVGDDIHTDKNQFFRETPALVEWINSDRVPDTLGRFLLVCDAVKAIAKDSHQSDLVPIAGSNYSDVIFARKYLVPFTAALASDLNTNGDNSVTGIETWMGWRAGEWTFDDPPVKAYYQCIQEICRQFPAGFLGLDREQASRRFVSGNAAMIASGLWDAKSLMLGAEGELVTADDPASPGEVVTTVDGEKRKNFKFKIGIMDFPIPGPDEKWYDLVTGSASEATANGGASYMVYQRSPNKEWAIDFLRFMTSVSVNEEFNEMAGWLPITVGAKPSERLLPFVGTGAGLAPSIRLNLDTNDSGNLRVVHYGQFQNFLAGDITYKGFVEQIVNAANSDRSGVDRIIYEDWVSARDRVLKQESLLSMHVAGDLLLDDDEAKHRAARVLRQSVLWHDGALPRVYWQQNFPEQPFPQY